MKVWGAGEQEKTWLGCTVRKGAIILGSSSDCMSHPSEHGTRQTKKMAFLDAKGFPGDLSHQIN